MRGTVVLLEHRVKADEGHEYHKVIRDRIEQAIKKVEEKKAREARMQGRRLSFGFGQEEERVSLSAEDVANYFWDYNTVEMILLACSILVCLAGVMFESDRFVGRNDLDYQRLMISVGVMLVIMFSCFYYGIVLLSEITGHTPGWLKKWMAKNKWGSKLGKNGDDDDSDDELGIEMAFKANPMHKGEGGEDAEMGTLKNEMGKVKGERDQQVGWDRPYCTRGGV